jgi:hypothetical protein
LEKWVWPSGYTVTSFIRRVITIKSFFPKLFPDLGKYFNATIGKFMQRKTEKDY